MNKSRTPSGINHVLPRESVRTKALRLVSPSQFGWPQGKNLENSR